MAFSKRVAENSGGTLDCRVVQLDSEFAFKRAYRVWLPLGAEPPAGVSRGRWAREGIESFEKSLLAFISKIEGSTRA